MKTFRALRWLVLGGTVACGARTGLPVPDDDGSEGGETSSSKGGAGAGGAEPIICDDLVPSTPAHVRLPNGAATVLSVEMVRPPSAPGLACIVSDVANDDGTWDVAHGCFEAWASWPGSLGMAFLSDGTEGGVAATEGRKAGYAILLGSGSGATPRATFDVPPTQSEVGWMSLPMQATGHRATFVARAPDGAFFGGLARRQADVERLEVIQIDPQSPLFMGEIACASGPIAAAAVATTDDIVIVSSTGEALTDCPTALAPGPPSGLQVLALGRAGGAEVWYDAWYTSPVLDVAAITHEGSVWVARDSGGAASVIALGPGGAAAAPITIGKQTRGAVALAPRGHSVAAAFVQDGPGGAASIGVVEIDAEGDVHELGQLDTTDAPWVRDLEIIVEPGTGSLIVSYVGLIGTNERAFAWRLGCP